MIFYFLLSLSPSLCPFSTHSPNFPSSLLSFLNFSTSLTSPFCSPLVIVHFSAYLLVLRHFVLVHRPLFLLLVQLLHLIILSFSYLSVLVLCLITSCIISSYLLLYLILKFLPPTSYLCVLWLPVPYPSVDTCFTASYRRALDYSISSLCFTLLSIILLILASYPHVLPHGFCLTL